MSRKVRHAFFGVHKKRGGGRAYKPSTHAEFYEQFKFIAKELYRVLMPGRNMSFHCMNLPTSKTRDGYTGIRDFRSELIRIFEEVGFIFHSEVCIWKDPVTAMQRTKALGKEIIFYKNILTYAHERGMILV